MTEVDPQALTAAGWDQIGSSLFYLWAFVFFMGGVASNFLVAHALIPTLVWTHHLPSRVMSVRPVFYVLTFIALAGVIWAMANFVSSSEILRTTYPKVWI